MKIGIVGALTCSIGLWAQTPGTLGLTPRTSAADYQAHAEAGTFSIGAEFTGHDVGTSQGTLNTEEYVVVEVGIFGSPEAKLKLSAEDFSLRINGRKAPLPSQSYVLALRSLKDPEWEPPASEQKKSKTSMGGGGGGGQESSGPPPPVKVPIELQRKMAQNVQKSVLPEGDRALPQAGLLFFQYRGKTKGIQSLELIYTGPAGTATLTLQP